MEGTGAKPKRRTLKPSTSDTHTSDDEDEMHVPEFGDGGVNVQKPRPFWASQVCLSVGW